MRDRVSAQSDTPPQKYRCYPRCEQRALRGAPRAHDTSHDSNSFKASVTASRAAEAAVAWGTLDDCFAACELPQQHQLGTLCEPILRKTVIQGPSQTRKDLAHFPTLERPCNRDGLHMKNATIKFLLPNAFPISKTGFYNEIQAPKVKISPRGFS